MKRAILAVAPEFIGYMFIGNTELHFKIVHSLPEDAKFISCHYYEPNRTFRLVYESEEFKDIDGQPPVLESPLFIKVQCPFLAEHLIPEYEP